MKITKIEALPIRMPVVSTEVCDGSQDDIIVRVHTDEGIIGVGEVSAPPLVIKAILESPSSYSWSIGFAELLIGEDPLQPARIWEKVYEGTISPGRRGLGIHALGAIDIALYDIAGKALAKPVYKLLGGAQKNLVVPYASILATGDNVALIQKDGLAKLEQAVEQGFRAAKMEILYGSMGSDKTVLEFISKCRKLIGDDIDLLIDVGYRWRDAKAAIPTAQAMEEYNIYLLETPIHTDNIQGYADLRAAVKLRIAMGELLSTRFEFLSYIDKKAVDVVQPNVGRVGGLTEALRVGRLAHDNGLLCIPHAWKSGISIAASLHLAAALPNAPYFEFMLLSGDTTDIRRRLATHEFSVQNGFISLPETPGLGVDVNTDFLAAYSMV